MFMSVEKDIVRTEFLLCALFVLVPNHPLFQKMDLRRDISRDGSLLAYFVTNEQAARLLPQLLNSTLVRQLVYTIIGPYLTSSDGSLNSRTSKNTSCNELLKRYIKKFTYVYTRYFLKCLKNYNGGYTDEQLNNYAVGTLVSLLGL